MIDRLPSVGRLLKLRQKYGDERLEAACERAIAFGDPAYKTVRRILKEGLENQPVPVCLESPPATQFVRTADELVGHIFGGEPWN